MLLNLHQASLEKQLSHAFRYGSSAVRFGLIPQSVSDHLPIVADLPLGTESIKLLSWNLLADEHLFNNFMNISGSDYLEDALNDRLKDRGNNIYAGNMYHLFAEIAQYLFKNAEDGGIKITRELLKGFISNKDQPSRRARSRNHVDEQTKTAQVEEARRTLVDILSDTKDPNAHEYQLALKQCVELIDHIKSPDGALQWNNRFKRLTENHKAVAELLDQDLLTFQECTNPDDMKELFTREISGSKKMTFITHNLNPSGGSTDNLVLAFNSDKYKLVEEPVKTNFEGKKPALYCKLQDIKTGQVFIIGSIHHPGGTHDLRDEIIKTVKELQGNDSQMPFYIAGDYNHTAEQFLAFERDVVEHEPEIFYPLGEGTMAGSDYGNMNRSIDAIMSNQALSGRIKVSSSIVLAPPARASLNVQIAISNTPKISNTDALLKHHIIERQKAYKEKLGEIMAIKHEDDDLRLGQRIAIPFFG